MNIASSLPEPLNTFVIDVPKDTYYDFELEVNSTYPLKGVTYPVDYGNVPGYKAEDGHELDLFVGSDTNGKLGYFLVERGYHIPNEHKFYVGLTDSDLDKILSELKPVLIENKEISTISDLLSAIEKFKDKP